MTFDSVTVYLNNQFRRIGRREFSGRELREFFGVPDTCDLFIEHRDAEELVTPESMAKVAEDMAFTTAVRAKA